MVIRPIFAICGYVEIWNEREIGKMMWSGKNDDSYRLYGTASKAIKFPQALLSWVGLRCALRGA